MDLSPTVDLPDDLLPYFKAAERWPLRLMRNSEAVFMFMSSFRISVHCLVFKFSTVTTNKETDLNNIGSLSMAVSVK